MHSAPLAPSKQQLARYAQAPLVAEVEVVKKIRPPPEIGFQRRSSSS
jgi:hypothetical protein